MGKYLDSRGLGYFWDKVKAYVAQQVQAVGALTGVKGDAESTYRTGNVNLTPADIGVGAIGLKDSLSASDIPSLAASKITSGTLAVARGGTGAATASANAVFAGPSSGSTAAAPSFRALVAADIPNHSTAKLTSGTLGIARGGTGSTAVTQVVSNSYETIYAWGPMVMVQVHGRTGAAGGSGNFISTSLASYAPSYNVSALVSDASGSSHVARLWVDTSGNIKLASVGYTTSAAWYGTLVYMRK